MNDTRKGYGWRPRSPNPTPCDFFLKGYLKPGVFKHRPRASAIREKIVAIQKDL